MHKFSTNIGDKKIEVELRNLAEEANASALVKCGETVVLVTAVMSNSEFKGDFLPLTVNYEERYYAAGEIYGSRYVRREGRPSDEAIITARLIDRAIRPLFPQDFRHEVQVIITCLSWDEENDPDTIGLLGTSLVLSISDIPWAGPVGVVRVGRANNQFLLNPIYKEREKSDLDLVLAGIKQDNEILINMIEGQAQQVEEQTICDATKEAEKYLDKLIEFQAQIAEKVGKEKISYETRAVDIELEKELKEFLGSRLSKILISGQEGSSQKISDLKQELINYIKNKYLEEDKTTYASEFFEGQVDELMRESILKSGKRPDGRGIDEVRKLYCEVGTLPRTHGSGLFCRGKTKALSILTLGAPGDQKLLEGMEIVGKKRFMHHYNFPPYSAGEVRTLRAPARREIGHGMLAEKALKSLIPSFEQFPYTIRIVSEILSSNGSTSMASVCGSSLALMDAGVPIKTHAAGIAMGLMLNRKLTISQASQQRAYKVLTDIQGPEDHHGDMDFKVAGTRNGITAIQMDVKTKGITERILKEALYGAQKARFQILDEMERVLPKPHPKLSPYAPKILTIQIDPEKIGELIGPGGKTVKGITEKYGVDIDIEDSGRVFASSKAEAAAQKAIAYIKKITQEITVGSIFQGKVKRILDFGALVEIMPHKVGLVHISELAPYRVKNVSSVVKVGQEIPVKVISIDEQGRIDLSLKQAKKSHASTKDHQI